MKDVQSVEFTEVAQSNTSGEKMFTGLDKRMLEGVKVELECVVGGTEITLDQLYSLEAGEVVKLQQATQDPIKLYLNGNVVAMGRLVAADGKFGVEITDVPVLTDE
ncbi:FliM/FliN family flagellar motor switch protein [Pseudoalteromonas sp. MMG022]|uniref:FliM/FliN family flagellar motor switch protein n=1 Tax=Pseudoalteromonas sp. MMG022 TaxID=2909978 RepID=UPI001F20D1E7|nr:FliM/FliN family flagellar motor switch protein [Pseudoalteromonas sp. MMG022]MCF6436998.1 FliM/FliN family flagellar motor switch protein [Pseudoalteromonas sp. MMG022]